ncbi:hypothetical protein BH18GEM1_BH18GEM1_23320 [soil metagenome]
MLRTDLSGFLTALVGLTVACGGPAAGGTAGIPAWPDTLQQATAFDAPRGFTPLRAILHVHSVYSHDACDGEPQDEAERLNEGCLAHFRQALCAANVGAAFLTEHDRFLVRADSLAEALVVRPGDTRLIVDGRLAASRVRCPDGEPGPILFAGAENVLMPVAFDSLPGGGHEARRDFYEADTPDAAETFRRFGAIVLISHPEDLPLARLARLDPDGIEIYNPHANFAPQHRPSQGLSRLGAIRDILPFYLRATDAHPDLALLPMFHANHEAIDRWDALLASRRVFGFGASDAHENALPWNLADGDRGDSYFRMIPWVTNVLLLERTGGTGVAAIEEALREGRLYVVIEAWGTPSGFDFRLAGSGPGDGPQAVTEMGSTVALAPGQRLIILPPTVAGRDPDLPEPAVRMRLYRIAPSGARTIVAESSRRIDVPITAPGAYRVEVGIVPRHLAPYLGRSAERFLREVPWIYSNPIRVVESAR